MAEALVKRDAMRAVVQRAQTGLRRETTCKATVGTRGANQARSTVVKDQLQVKEKEESLNEEVLDRQEGDVKKQQALVGTQALWCGNAELLAQMVGRGLMYKLSPGSAIGDGLNAFGGGDKDGGNKGKKTNKSRSEVDTEADDSPAIPPCRSDPRRHWRPSRDRHEVSAQAKNSSRSPTIATRRSRPEDDEDEDDDGEGTKSELDITEATIGDAQVKLETTVKTLESSQQALRDLQRQTFETQRSLVTLRTEIAQLQQQEVTIENITDLVTFFHKLAETLRQVLKEVKRFEFYVNDAVDDRLHLGISRELRLTSIYQYALSSAGQFDIFYDIGDMSEQVNKNHIAPGFTTMKKMIIRQMIPLNSKRG
ncbi:hypothetical protein CNMCM5793_002092 [Aspergillus hiratsukae]|uniref:Uncharacterized protein n=1 Tax=Aspergillus hiratsukae TaxID=1194566 RepID=A0A8H6UF36_9EURO|nr:hypothetical protein CNMCM5793_002092 [Aspergillus hiratsukae]